MVRPWLTVDMGELMICDTEVKELQWCDNKGFGILITYHGTYKVTKVPHGWNMINCWRS